MNSSSGETPLKLGVGGISGLSVHNDNLSETGIVNIDCRLSSWETYNRLAALRTPDKRRPMGCTDYSVHHGIIGGNIIRLYICLFHPPL
jgi:hypothetical protein